MEIATIEMVPGDRRKAFGLALVCRALECRTGEERRGGDLVLHVVGPKSVIVTLEPLLPRLAGQFPEGSTSWIIGYAVAVAERLREHVMIPDGAGAAVEAEFRDRFNVYGDQAAEPLDHPDYQAGAEAGQGFQLFQIPLPRGETG